MWKAGLNKALKISLQVLSATFLYLMCFVYGEFPSWFKQQNLLLMSAFMEHTWKNMIERNAEGFPGGIVVKNLPANAGDTGSSPGLGRSHMP